MSKNEIRIEDRQVIQEIYQQVKQVGTHLSELPRFEVLLNQALNTAEVYGKDHPLYSSLQQTRKELLIPARSIPKKSKDCYFALSDLKLYFLGDLIGWF